MHPFLFFGGKKNIRVQYVLILRSLERQHSLLVQKKKVKLIVQTPLKKKVDLKYKALS